MLESKSTSTILPPDYNAIVCNLSPTFEKRHQHHFFVILIKNCICLFVVDEKDICISLILRPLTDVIDTKPAIVEAQDYYEPSLRASSSYEILCRDETWTSDLLDESSSMK